MAVPPTAHRTGWISLCLVALVASACRRQASAPNVLVVVVDTLRADRLGSYGNPRGLTPYLDQLARRGTVFTNARAASSWTCPSVASLLTSRYQSQHHVVGFGSRVSDEEVTFAERLAARGWVGGGCSANLRLLQRLGYAQGFRFWTSDPGNTHGGPPGAEIRRDCLDWLDRSWGRTSAHPALLYLQYMEPHSPYEPPEPFRSRFARDAAGLPFDRSAVLQVLRDRLLAHQPVTRADIFMFERLYDAEVAAVDDEVRLLMRDLDDRGFLDDALVIITSDHGEEFAEHGGAEHGRTLFEESVHVPLLILGPGVPRGVRVDDAVSLVDVAPTLLQLLGLPPEPRFAGQSLVPLMRGGDAARVHREQLLFELQPIGLGPDARVHERGLVQGTSKLLVGVGGTADVYDLAADPGETRPNPERLASQATALTTTLEQQLAELQRQASAPLEAEPVDEATQQKLRALGYQF